MNESKKVSALIFMKDFSERVPKKNLRILNGKPLFHWVMDALSTSKLINEIIINTDSDEIADSATSHYDVTIHMRPNHLLEIDHNEANQIIEYDLSLSDSEYFLQTHSTNPFLTTDSIDKSINTFFDREAEYNSLISVTEVYKRFYYTNGKPVNHDPNNMCKTQDMPPLYEENSLLYIFSRSSFEEKKNRIGSKPQFFPTSSYESVDIDYPIDFEFSESLMQFRNKNTF
jgi:CMP-N-acetylneuraminic acid synthetase